MCRTAVLGLLVVLAALVASDAVAATADACKRCRTECREDVAACVDADPRLATCRPKRLASCRKRATRACKRNRKKCCLRTCRDTGLVVCCGSATSATTLPGETTSTTFDGASTTTMTSGSTTSTTLGCTTDLDCPSCGCCNTLSHVCGPPTGNGAVNCCNIPPNSTPLSPGACGPQSPTSCPMDAVCPPPGQATGGIEYTCTYCLASGRIIEQYNPSGQLPKNFPSNECLRH